MKRNSQKLGNRMEDDKTHGSKEVYFKEVIYNVLNILHYIIGGLRVIFEMQIEGLRLEFN